MQTAGQGYLLKLCARLRPQKAERMAALRWERSRDRERPHQVRPLGAETAPPLQACSQPLALGLLEIKAS